MGVSDYEFVRHGAKHIMLNEVLLQSGAPTGAPDGQNTSFAMCHEIATGRSLCALRLA